MTKGTRGTRGMGRVYKQAGSAMWWLKFYHNGKVVRESSGSTRKADAVRLLRARIAAMESGRFVPPDARKVTFEDLRQFLKRDYAIRGRKSWGRANLSMDRLAVVFGNDLAVTITPERLDEYVRIRLEDDGMARATVSNELGALKRAFKLAIDKSRLPALPRFPNLGKLRNARTEFLEDWEIALILGELEHAGERGAVLFTYRTGWRWKSEVRTLKWDQVDEDEQTVTLWAGTTKNDEARVFPYGADPDVAEVITAARAYTTDVEQRTGKPVPWVFHVDGKPLSGSSHGFYTTWKAACLKHSIVGRDGTHKILHDCRRSTVRRYEREGVSREIAKRLVGHKTDDMYSRYNIVTTKDLREAVQRVAQPQTQPVGHS